MYKLDDKLHFGKYEGFTIKEIFCGTSHISQQFLIDFLNFKLKDRLFKIEEFVINQEIDAKVKIDSFEILINNELTFELNIVKNNSTNVLHNNAIYHATLETINWDLVLDDHIDAKGIFDNANDITIELNKINLTNYTPFSDANYINWCIKNLDTFFLKPEDLYQLQFEYCYHFYGVQLFFAGLGGKQICKYKVRTFCEKFRFDDDAIRVNEKKFLA